MDKYKNLPQELKDSIGSFLCSDLETISVPMVPIQDFADLLENDFGFESLEQTGDERNGWQVDFWYTFVHKEKGSFVLAGSLFYGDWSFSIK